MNRIPPPHPVEPVICPPLPVAPTRFSPELPDIAGEEEDALPTKEKYKHSFRRFKSFKLTNSPENFKVGDFIYIRAQDEKSTWLAKIVAIRASDERHVFLTVDWFYTDMAQLREAECTNPPKKIGGNEVYFSNDTQVISVSTVDDIAAVLFYDEADPFHEPFDENARFYRSIVVKTPIDPNAADAVPQTKKRKRGKANTRTVTSKIVPCRGPTCTCGRPYQPLPLDRNPMVFCPRLTCLKWYHTSCISPYLPPYPDPHDPEKIHLTGLELFARAPPDLVPKYIPIPPSMARGYDRVATIKSIIKVGKSSIIRGTSEGGIVGETVMVLRSRVILRDWPELMDETAGFRFGMGKLELEDVLERWYAIYEEEDAEGVGVGDEGEITFDAEEDEIKVRSIKGKVGIVEGKTIQDVRWVRSKKGQEMAQKVNPESEVNEDDNGEEGGGNETVNGNGDWKGKGSEAVQGRRRSGRVSLKKEDTKEEDKDKGKDRAGGVGGQVKAASGNEGPWSCPGCRRAI